jgi:hypothetical protein
MLYLNGILTMRTFLALLLCTTAATAETYHYACTRPNEADGGPLRVHGEHQ